MSGLRLSAAQVRANRDANVESSASVAPISHTTRPMVTGSSVIAIKCTDGVVIAADTLASYGSLARFRQVSRLHKATEQCLLGVGGDYSDFQEIKMMIDRITTRDYCFDDGHMLSPKAIHQYVARVMYNRRNKMDPLWNKVVIAGMQDGVPMLGLVDLVGTHFESEVIATGFGEYLGLPLLRKAYRDDITVAEAKKVVEETMKVLFYRDARTSDSVQIATVTKDGVEIGEASKLETEWSYKAFVGGARSGDVSTW